MMQLMTLPTNWQQDSSMFIEGVLLASNLASKPLDPEHWLVTTLGEHALEHKAVFIEHINKQHNLLQRSEYVLSELVSQNGLTDLDLLADFAEGFMTLWPTIEMQWQDIELGDGTVRMLQALLTTFMLAIDEEQTQAQMRAAGIETPPSVMDFIDQLDVMVMEVSLAADEAMLGAKAQSVNPFKDIGRNDPCPCQSGKKFKQCCSQ